MYFSADDGVHGRELWKYTPEITSPPPATGKGVMGDYVWRDDNGDGIQSPGEPGMANTTVELQTCSGDLVTTTTTDTTGHFSFTNVAPAFFQMQFKLPAGYVFSPEKSTDLFKLDSNANVNTGITPCFDMTQGWKRLAIDAGMIPQPTTGGGTGLMGDYVWLDENGNGLQDSSETGLATIAIDLQTCDGTYLASTTSSSTGSYQFDKLAAGHYRMQFHLPAGYQFSPEKVNDQFKLDSNVNVTTGLTGCYDMTQGWKRRAIDAGMVPESTGGPVDKVTLVKAIYFSADKKLWIRAASDAAAGSANITASMLVNGGEQSVGVIGWKANKSFYQQQFLNIANVPTSIRLVSDQGGVDTGTVEVR